MKKIYLRNLRKVEIYILLKQRFRKQLFANLFNRFKLKKEAAMALSLNEGYSLTRYQKGLRFCPLSTLKKIYSVLNYDLDSMENNVQEIKQGSSGKTGLAHGIRNPKFPYKESKELAYLIGKFIGDGCITFNKNDALMVSYCNYDETLRNEFKKQAKEFFGDIYLKETYKNVLLPSIAGFIILNFCKNFKTFDSRIPSFIMKNKEYTKCFLRAIFEDEGCVFHKGDNRNINIGMSNKSVITHVHNMLKNLGIKPNAIRKKKTKKSIFYSFEITGRENFKRFLHEVGFTSKYYKNKKLIETINSYKFYQNRIGESREIILNKLNNTKKFWSTKDLCKSLNMKKANLLQHLAKLEKQGKIMRFTKKPLQDSKGRLQGNFSHKWALINKGRTVEVHA